MCSTAARRRSRSHEAGELLGSAQPERMIDLLRRLHLTVLVGQRLVNAGFDLDPRLREEVELATALGRQRGGAHELATQAILDSLEAAGIRALGLKGSVLARALYDDVAWRSAGDIDILVAAGDLAGAIEVVEAMDWRWQRSPDRSDRLPVLHETLTHSTLPRVELPLARALVRGSLRRRRARPRRATGGPRAAANASRGRACDAHAHLRARRSFRASRLRRTSRHGGIRGAPARISMR